MTQFLKPYHVDYTSIPKRARLSEHGFSLTIQISKHTIKLAHQNC